MNNFEDLGIGPGYVQGLAELNIIEPTDIQRKVIPLLLGEATDLVAQAQTGTGKTAAYGLPLLAKVVPQQKQVQGLVLCPTRELAQQVAKQLFRFTKYTDKIFTEAVYGGEYIDKQITKLQRPTHLIVATPGRLIDLVKRKAVDLSHVKQVVLDEADEMLSMGFKDELDEILDFLPDVKSTWLFSATIPQGIQEIISSHLAEDAIRIAVNKEDVVNSKITHQYEIADDMDKFRALMRFLSEQGHQRGVVFCKTKAATEELAIFLIDEEVAAGAIHGDLYQKEREKVMRAFKKENIRVLVATDIAARGMDISNLGFVVHYELPENHEAYTHRSGRTARAGETGISRCLVNANQVRILKNYERSLGISFEKVNG
ncbi:MAG: DEAD/DEAH box helicase [Flavobacteriaceae bacterium]|nr:DEAD/DEAH box helicase [Flavobacteriales bacterium]MDP4665778.1 DEAD/DEAH box helicase [Flavobacteriaceae bacterium]